MGADTAAVTPFAGQTEHFVSVGGMDTYYERYGSCPPVILIPAGGSQMSTWRFNIGALSGSHEVWTLDLSSPDIPALVLGRILVCSDRDFRPPTTSQKQKHLTSLNQQMEAL